MNKETIKKNTPENKRHHNGAWDLLSPADDGNDGSFPSLPSTSI
jgi:hypothetical protein